MKTPAFPRLEEYRNQDSPLLCDKLQFSLTAKCFGYMISGTEPRNRFRAVQ
jgi:hypothetical protein